MCAKNAIDRKEVKLTPLLHKGERRIALHFPNDTELIAIAKKLGASWSVAQRCWHVPNGREHIAEVFAAYKGSAWVDYSGMTADQAHV